MRGGLVVVGLVIAIVGAAVFLTVVLYPPTTQQTSVLPVREFGTAAPAGEPGSKPPVFPASAVSTAFLTWTANASVAASFYDVHTCPDFNATSATCSGGHPLMSWSASAGATFSTNTSTIQCPCYLILQNSHPYGVSVEAILAEFRVSTVPALTTFTYVAVFFGSLILLGIGGVATFLGLFLRAGVYRRSGVDEEDPELADLDEWDEPPGPPT